jgi:hypothetical protein
LISKAVISAFLLVGVVLAIPAVASYNLQVNATSPSGLVYATDFESVTKVDAYHLNLGNDINGVPMQNTFTHDSSGATMWIEGVDRHTPGVTCHSGSRCIGMETGTGGTSSNRLEFNILDLETHFGSGADLTGKEMYISVWLYLASFSAPDWYLFTATYQSQAANPNEGNLYLPIEEWQMWNSSGVFDTVATWGTGTTGPWAQIKLNDISGWHPPLGHWFNVKYYVYFHPTQGIVKGWIDNTLMINASNIETLGYAGQTMLTTIAKDYHSASSTLYQMWVDDLQVYNSLPNSISTSSTTSSTTSTTTSSTSTSSSTTTSSTIKTTIRTTSNSTSYLVVKRRR